MEFSGYHNGNKVMGIGLETIANIVETDYLWNIPENISLEEASTLPVIYLTVYYSFLRANLFSRKNKKY